MGIRDGDDEPTAGSGIGNNQFHGEEEYQFLSASLVKEVSALGESAKLKKLAPPHVIAALRKKFLARK